MKKSIYRKSAWDVLRTAILPVVFTLSVMFLIVSGLQQTESASSSEALRILEDSIRRAVITSYAIEGRYPESIEYIEEHFGIHVDRTRFIVHYNIFASNILPEVRVVAL
jgi:hypothetical protein